ncbi:hypothetical protein [Burkholderia gladioli]|uniref:hypothetical protein n=1 Tax=Burkholderia gladioli TaxID=28095 RepID=UPI0016411677|nr:hypothetical protein [Burkholderia gladioli]
MKKGRRVFGVFANTSYEGGDIVCSFDDEPAAKAFAEKCRAYDQKRPECPEFDDPEDVWDTYYKRNDRWEKRHPARPFIQRDYVVAPFQHHEKQV